MLLVRRGAADDPPGKEGLAAITVDMLDEGSGGRSAIEMHEALARDWRAARFRHRVGCGAPERHRAQPLCGRGADAAGRHGGPAGPCASPTSRACGSFGSIGLTQLRDMPGAVADRAFVRLLYGDHPYGHTPLGNEQSLRVPESRRRARSFMPRRCRPSDDDARGGRRLRSRDDRAAGRRGLRRLGRGGDQRWRHGDAACRSRPRLNVVPRPGAPQSELRIGHVAVAQEHARLSRARGREHGARRPVRQPDQPEPARGQGVHLRRPHVVRLPAAARALRAAGQRADGRHRRRRSRSRSTRSPPFAARGRSRPRSSRLASRR